MLVETNVDGSTTTTFTVESLSGKISTLLVIETEFSVREGFAGTIQRFLIGAILRRIYAKELDLIRRFALNPDLSSLS